MIIDLVFAGVLVYGIYIGYSNGIIKTVFTVVSIIAGFLVTAHFYRTVTDVLIDITQYDNPLMMFGGMALTFLITMVFLRTIGNQIEKIFKFAHINIVNKVVGGIVMSLLFASIFSLIVGFLVDARLFKDQTAESRTLPYLEIIQEQASLAYATVSPKLKDTWNDMSNALDEVSQSTDKSIIDDFGGKERKTRTTGGEEDSTN